MKITISNDKTDEIIDALPEIKSQILEALGMQAEGNAVQEITNMGAIDTGRLRNSISHAVVDENTVAIGTNVEYAPYVELGTYKMASRPFLRNAIANYSDEYKAIIQQGLENA